MMKKIISILLSFVLLFSVVTAFADTNVNADEEIDLLKNLGILSGISSSDESITRGEFASFTSDLTNIKPMLDDDEIQFADVSQSHPYYVSIIHVATCGFMNGRSKYIFAPDETISFSEAVKVLVELAGYKHIAIAEGGYPTGYMKVATRIGILDGISGSSSLSKNECFKMIYNLLEVKTIEPSSYGDETNLSFNETGKTYLEDVFHIYHIEDARVTANEITSLTSAVGCGEERTVINNEIFKDNVNAASLLGYAADIYYIEDSGMKTVVYAKKSVSVKEVVISADDLIDLNIDSISYGDGDKVLNKSFSPSVDFIYNKVYCSFSSLSNEDISECGVKLVDFDGNGSVDVVFVEKFTNYYIETITHHEYLFKDKISGKFVQLNKDAVFCVYNSEGKDIGFSGLKPKMLISVLKSKDELSYNIYTSSNSYGGTVTEMSDNGFYFGDTYCPVSSELKNSSHMPRLGDMGTVYIDINGYAAMFVLKASEAGNYGYMIKASMSTGLDPKLQLRILEQSGDFSNYYVSKKCKIDGVAIKGLDDPRVNHLKIDFNSDNKTTPTNRFIPQLISYALNGYGEISVIDTEYMDATYENENSLISKCGKSENSPALDQFKGLYLGKRYISTTDLIAFSVPEDYNETDESLYGVYDYNGLRNTFGAAKLKTYNENKVYYTNLVVHYVAGVGTGAVSPKSPLFLVDYVSDAYENDEIVKKIYGFYNEQSIVVTCDASLYQSKLPQGRQDLKRGDILRVIKDHLNNIVNFTITYNIDDRYNFDKGLPYNGNYLTEFHDCTGTVYETEDNLMLLGHGWSENLTEASFDKNEFHCAATNSWGGIYLYDEEKDEVRLADASDIKSYKDFGNKASRLYCYFEWGNCAGIVIIKLKGF